MSLNRKGHGMSFPIWMIWLLSAWVTVADPYFELAKMTDKYVATATYVLLFTLQTFMVYKYGWKTLIPLFSYIIWGVWSLP